MSDIFDPIDPRPYLRRTVCRIIGHRPRAAANRPGEWHCARCHTNGGSYRPEGR